MAHGDGLRRVLDRLQAPRERGEEWVARCPVPDHRDTDPSFSVSQGDKGAVFICRAGCSPESVVSALGLTMDQLYDDWKPSGAGTAAGTGKVNIGSNDDQGSTGGGGGPPTLGVLSRHFKLPERGLRDIGLADIPRGVRVPAWDLEGNELAAKIRTSLTGKPKYVYAQRGSSASAYGLWKLHQERRRRTKRHDLVLVEGESDCWVLWHHGVPAVGLPGSSTVSKTLTMDVVEGFDRLLVVAEPDKGGAEFVQSTAERLEDLGWVGEVRALRLPTKDPAELHRRDPAGFRDAFSRAVRESERVDLDDGMDGLIKSMADVEAREPEFLWHPYIPKGMVTMMWGQPEAGKSYIVASLMAMLSSGQPLPGSEVEVPPKSCLLFAVEDDYEVTWAPRLTACAADRKRIHYVDKSSGFSFDEAGFRKIRRAIRKVRPALVVFDPLVNYLGSGVNMISQNEVRTAMSPLIELARETDVSVLVIAHGGRDTAKIGPLGSIDFTALPRSALLVARNPRVHPTRGLGGWMAHFKSSSTRHGETWHYEVRGNRLAWTGTSEMTAFQVQAAVAEGYQAGGGGQALALAVDFLRRVLADGEWHPAAEVQEEAEDLGVTTSALYRARQHLGVETEKRQFQGPSFWRWVEDRTSLFDDGADELDEPGQQELEI